MFLDFRTFVLSFPFSLVFLPVEDILLALGFAAGFLVFFAFIIPSLLSATVDFLALGFDFFSTAVSLEPSRFFLLVLSLVLFEDFFFGRPFSSFSLSSPSTSFGCFLLVFLTLLAFFLLLLSISRSAFSFSFKAFFSFFSRLFSSLFSSSFTSFESLNEPEAPAPFVCTRRPLPTLLTSASLI